MRVIWFRILVRGLRSVWSTIHALECFAYTTVTLSAPKGKGGLYGINSEGFRENEPAKAEEHSCANPGKGTVADVPLS